MAIYLVRSHKHTCQMYLIACQTAERNLRTSPAIVQPREMASRHTACSMLQFICTRAHKHINPPARCGSQSAISRRTCHARLHATQPRDTRRSVRVDIAAMRLLRFGSDKTSQESTAALRADHRHNMFGVLRCCVCVAV